MPAGSPEGGQFGSGGGGGTSEKPESEGVTLDPKVIDVGGDNWNKSTAKRLEREYQAAKPKLDALNDNAVKESPAVHAISIGASRPKTDDEYAADWIALDAHEKDAAYAKWANENMGKFNADAAATAEAWDKLNDAEKGKIAAGVSIAATDAEFWNSLSDDEQDSVYATWATENKDEFKEDDDAQAFWDGMSEADKGKIAHEQGVEHTEFIPEEWDQMTADQQSEVEEKWKADTFSEFLESEQNSFYENDGPDYAKQQVVENFNENKDYDWAWDAINDVRDEFEADENHIPYDTGDLVSAISLGEWEIGSYKQKLEVEFDDAKLQKPSDAPPPPDPNQPEFPGMPEKPPVDYSTHLTPEMREAITDALTKAFEKEADHISVDPPEYLEESAKEFQDQMWGEKSDDEKFEWAKKHTDILDEPTEGEPAGSSKPIARSEVPEIDALPQKYDPLNDTSGTDYVRTQKLAKYLSVVRAVQILKERSIEGKASSGKPLEPDVRDIAMMDNELWEGWKSSSTSSEGRVLQIATADELGGRMNKKTSVEIDRDNMIAWANDTYANIGGYEGVKAYLRAKWETSQYLLDKAGTAELQLFRGYTEDAPGKYQKGAKHYAHGKIVNQFRLLPTLDVQRNGAVSTTTDRNVANNWKKGNDHKLTLRAVVPRTAAVSVPAYGINVHSEHEVVVAGTAWKGWDVWAGSAPTFTDTPLHAEAA